MGALGKVMRIELESGWGITLGPFSQEEGRALLPYLNEPRIGITTTFESSGTPETQDGFREKSMNDPDSEVWGIYPDEIEKDGKTLPSKLVGVTSGHLADKTLDVWTTGILIADQDYWGNGIASLAHLGRTWWLANMRNVLIIKSGALAGEVCTNYEGDLEKFKQTGDLIYGNWPSRLALAKVGYRFMYTDPHCIFRLGKWFGMWHMRWINPLRTSEIYPKNVPKDEQEAIEKGEIALEKANKMIKNI